MANQRRDIRRLFGEAVRTRRLKLGLSQELLAAKAGINRTYIGDIERGTRNVAIVNATKIVRALGMSLSEFFRTYEIGD